MVSPTQKVIHASCLQDLRVQTAVLSFLWFLGLATCFATPRVILQRRQHRSLEGEMWPDAQEACKSEYLNCLPRFASDLLGDVRLSLFLSSYSCINIVICTEVFIKVSFMNVRMMTIWLSHIILKCLCTWKIFFFSEVWKIIWLDCSFQVKQSLICHGWMRSCSVVSLHY